MTPTPNEALTAESVKAGDIVRINGTTWNGALAKVTAVAKRGTWPISATCLTDGEEGIFAASEITSIGRPDEHGWIPHHGGECPHAPGAVIDVRYGDGEEAFAQTLLPGHGSWAYISESPHETDITHWRPHTPASQPITEGEEAELKRLAEAAEADNANPDYFAAVRSLEVFNQAANPAAILALIGKLEAQSAELSRLRECVRKDGAALKEAYGALVDCSEYLAPMSDAYGDSEGFTPNREMNLQSSADYAVEKIEQALSARARLEDRRA